MSIKKIIKTVSAIADTPQDSEEKKRQHRFLIFIGSLMSMGGIFWGSIALISGLPFQAMIPLGYAAITLINFTYLYYFKNFKIAQGIQLFISLMLPFLFQLALGGFISSGAQVFWAITAILGAFTFKQKNTIIIWFFIYMVLIGLSGLLDDEIVALNLVKVPVDISILFFTINISAVSLIIFLLFYYFVGSERKYRDSLEVNLANLKVAQTQLVESEKMSALGGLVAGVAHEVNTPLGISITAASIFKDKIKTLKAAIDAETLSKTDLDEFMNDVAEADEILIKNLDRAALLIKNFKMISVDQSSEELREFELNAYIQEVVSTFRNELKHHHVSLELELTKEPIEMSSYPGAISQIVLNLLQNAIVHAFDADTKGAKIILKTSWDGQFATVTCSDNGHGVDAKILDKVFEPFITTKRNKGGTGLGLNITYNLVTQKLGGRIRLDEEVMQGASFVMSFPCHMICNINDKTEFTTL